MSKRNAAKCCNLAEGAVGDFPDHTKERHRVNRIIGQVEGVRRMIDSREYCPKIMTQIQAIRAALKSLEASILEKHLHSCVKQALSSKNQTEQDEKLAELMELFKQN